MAETWKGTDYYIKKAQRIFLIEFLIATLSIFGVVYFLCYAEVNSRMDKPNKPYSRVAK